VNNGKLTDPTAQIFGIAQTATIHISASNGLGRHIQTLSNSSYELFATAYYVSDLLFVITIYLAKVSLVLFIMRLTPSYKTLYFCHVFIIALTLWMAGTVLSLAFQCPLPHPWGFMSLHSNQCKANIGALYYSISAIDILTDLIIVATPAVIVWNVRISRGQRCTVIGVFGSRLAVCICSALLLASLPAFVKSSDRSWEAVTPQTWKQVVQCLSIITACIPCMRPFLASLESGFMDSSMQGVLGTTYGGSSGQHGGEKKGSNSYALTSFAAGGHRAIIIPRILGSNHDIEGSTSKRLEPGLKFGTSVLPPQLAASSASDGSWALRRSGSLFLGNTMHSSNCTPSTTTISSGCRGDSKRADACHQEVGLENAESTKVLASRSSRRLNGVIQPGSVDEGCIRETREVMVSIERADCHLVDDVLFAHDGVACI